jgi:nicotinamidase-related amidase
MAAPAFYNPERVGKLFVPATPAAVAAGRAAGLPPASEDDARIILLLVDVQMDFVHPDGALVVPGAVDDTRRTIDWIYRHTHRLHTIAASLDCHRPLHIFFEGWWVDAEGNHPEPFTPILCEDVRNDVWRPLYEVEWSRRYVEKLEKNAKKELMIWPYHCLLGTVGQSLVPSLYEAVAYHGAARRTQPTFLTKGTIARTEHYSILEPEVKVRDEPAGRMNTAFLEILADHDLIYIAGQAKSHCVLETVESLMRSFGDRPEVLRKLRILGDCTSPVLHPEIDFEGLTDRALKRHADRGLRIVTTEDPLD